MNIALAILIGVVLVVSFSAASASWHWSSDVKVCGDKVIPKGQKCDLGENYHEKGMKSHDDSMKQHQMKMQQSHHHAPHNGMCAPGFVPLDKICVLDDRCGPGAYPGKICTMDGVTKKYLKPYQQKFAGISAENTICPEAKHLMFKSHDGAPACVKPSSVERLIQRGWADHFLPNVNPDALQNSESVMQGSFQVESIDVMYDGFTGFLASPISDESHPGVILIHEWWGLNDNIKQTAQKLASQGYVVLAVDLFDGKVATDAQTAMKLTGAFLQDKAVVNMNSAVDYLQTKHNVDSIGSVGWCFGGKQSLTLALNNDEMDATVIYYGRLVTDPQALSSISWPVLGIFAELDQGIPPKTVNEFEAALNEVGVPNYIYIYPGVDHAFANPTGERYAPQEADDAWNKTLEFLETNLKQ